MRLYTKIFDRILESQKSDKLFGEFLRENIEYFKNFTDKDIEYIQEPIEKFVEQYDKKGHKLSLSQWSRCGKELFKRINKIFQKELGIDYNILSPELGYHDIIRYYALYRHPIKNYRADFKDEMEEELIFNLGSWKDYLRTAFMLK